MKNNLIVILFLLIFSNVSNSFSQTYINNDSESKTNTLDVNDIENKFLMSQGVDDKFISTNLNATVFIDQIGNSNDVTINSKANESNFAVLQRGDHNNVYIGVTAKKINEVVFQNGNNHSFVDFSNSRGIHNLELVQSGNNQNLIWYGGNSISEKLKINMDGENQSIIVRNFN